MAKGTAFANRYRSPGETPAGRFGALSAPPPPSDLAAVTPFQRMIFPPRVEKLLSSQDFSVQDYAMTIGAGAGTTVSSAALRFTLPVNMVGWIQNFSIYLLTPTANTSVSFALRINEGPVTGFDNKQNPPGVANLIVVEYNELRVRLPMGATVDVLITNLNANGPWTVGGLIAGWYHSLADEIRIFGEAY